MRRTLWLAFSALVALLTTVAVADSSGPYTEALALGCHLPIPAKYRYNSRERDHFTWYLPADRQHGRIDLVDGGAPPRDEYEVLDQRQESHLTIMHLRFVRTGDVGESKYSASEPIAVFTSTQRLMLYGEAKKHANHMISQCVASPTPEATVRQGVESDVE